MTPEPCVNSEGMLTLNGKERKHGPESVPEEAICRHRRRAAGWTVYIDHVEGGRGLSYNNQSCFTLTDSKRKGPLANKHRFPHANGTVATARTLQCTPLSAHHANQNSPTGIPTLPIIALYKRCSGRACVRDLDMARACAAW
jgi:hypothetical protein